MSERTAVINGKRVRYLVRPTRPTVGAADADWSPPEGPFCEAMSPRGGTVCTREPGHVTDHAASDGDFIVEVWPTAPVAARIGEERPAEDPPHLMTPAEVAAAFKVTPRTVARWADAGYLTTIRTPGGHRRYLRSQVMTALENLTGR